VYPWGKIIVWQFMMLQGSFTAPHGISQMQVDGAVEAVGDELDHW
jgi:hypothetical protein